MKLPKSLPTITLMIILGAAASEKCLNLKRQYETCGYLQFCSQSTVEKGCRNCTDIYKHWCNEDRDTFRKRYPMCEVLCERDKRKEAEAEVERLSGKIRSLTLTLWIIGAFFSVGIIAAAVAFIVYRCRRPADLSSSLENGTATPEKTGCMERLRSFFSTACKRGQRRAEPAQGEDQVQTASPLVPSAPVAEDAV